MLETILFFATAIVLFPAAGFFISKAFFPHGLEKPERIVFSAVLGIIFPGILLVLFNRLFHIALDFFSVLGILLALIIASFLAFYLKKRKN